MKIAIVTFGTRGDVQPYLALAKALQSRGHEVLLAAPDNFQAWVEGHGVPFFPLGFDMREFLQKPEVRKILGGNLLVLGKLWRETVMPLLRNFLDATWQSCRHADVIIYHPKASGAVDVAEATGATPICALPIPMTPTAEFPIIVYGGDLGPRLNRLSHKLFLLSRPPYARFLDKWRKETLGLGKGPVVVPVGGFKGGLGIRLCAVSPTVLPRPVDWDAEAHMTGYWFLSEGAEWQPDSSLQVFLEAGDAPIYIGFGSMATDNAGKVTSVVLDALRRTGIRAILATGWGGLEKTAVPETVHMIESAPHDRLFSLVCAVVHHGGAGTTAAGLRAGKPTLVCPVAVDQPFWGHRVWKLGCGPKPQRLNRLKAQRFADALIDLTTTESYRNRAKAVAEGIANENGLASAIRIIEAIPQK